MSRQSFALPPCTSCAASACLRQRRYGAWLDELKLDAARAMAEGAPVRRRRPRVPAPKLFSASHRSITSERGGNERGDAGERPPLLIPYRSFFYPANIAPVSPVETGPPRLRQRRHFY